MTIMVAGGLTFAIPGITPDAYAANANLFVSAESTKFNDHIAGPQVIEVVITDSDINDTDQAKGEPIVSVNGAKLRMVQGTDGSWYAYFADQMQARIADSTSLFVVSSSPVGLDFGTICSAESGPVMLGIDTSETRGIAVPVQRSGTGGNPVATTEGNLATCTGIAGTDIDGINVVRESTEPNSQTGIPVGQIGLGSDGASGVPGQYWPFVQLYDFSSGGEVVVLYNKAGGTQSTTLTFDDVDEFASVTLDRSQYPQNAEVHATITDTWLNMDPTDEDSWTFGANAGDSTSVGIYYQVFDENGAQPGSDKPINNGNYGVINIASVTGDLMCDDNCKLFIDVNPNSAEFPVLTLQDNNDSAISLTGGNPGLIAANNATAFSVDGIGGQANLGPGSYPVTITETEESTGVFTTSDESDVSVLKITSNAARDKSATIEYNESPVSILVGFSTGSVVITPADDVWNSGEEIPVNIIDDDANKNSKIDETLSLADPNVQVIPALSTGNPFTLGDTGSLFQAVYSTELLILGPTNVTSIVGQTGGILVNSTAAGVTGGDSFRADNIPVDQYSDRGIIHITNTTGTTLDATELLIDLDATMGDLRGTFMDTRDSAGNQQLFGANLFNFDLRSVTDANTVDVYLVNSTAQIINATGFISDPDVGTTVVLIANDASVQSLTSLEVDGLHDALGEASIPDANQIGLLFNYNTTATEVAFADRNPIVADFISFGFTDDGQQASERVSNQIIRIEGEESLDNSAIFEGTLEFTMVNQLNINDPDTYTGLSTSGFDPTFIVIEDLTDEDAPRVNYLDTDSDGVVTVRTAQQEAPSFTGVVSLDQESYKIADTVLVTLVDPDLNVDSDIIDIYTVVRPVDGADGSNSNIAAFTDIDIDQVGSNVDSDLEFSFGSLGRLADITFDDQKWSFVEGCNIDAAADNGLADSGFSLRETGPATGEFTGSFQIPGQWCDPRHSGVELTVSESVTGLDIEVNYVDYRDASGEITETGDSAGVRASTGSVSLDRSVYPVPFGTPADFTRASGSLDNRSLFPVHSEGILDDIDDFNGEVEFITNGDLTVHIRVNDPDFDVSPSGEDVIAQDIVMNPGASDEFSIGPVKISVIRGSDEVILGYAGGSESIDGLIYVGDADSSTTRQFGPITEIAPSEGIFEYDLTIRFTDGPTSTLCPENPDYEALVGTERFDDGLDELPNNVDYCILQGDILQVEYTDPADASGNVNTVTDSATFDLRNGVLQTDKTVYIIGSDMILTLIEPDFDLDNDGAETYDLDLIEWDSDAATTTIGDLGIDNAAFDPEPTAFRETGDSTGIFQATIEIPQSLGGDSLERGEEIVLEYTDWGPSGSDYVGDEDEDINVTVYTSNFGATVELDQKVYTWTDKVYITIVAPDHNFDGDLVDEIGSGDDDDPIKVSTREYDLDNYKLVETGTDTGIFTGEVILTGFADHNADGDGSSPSEAFSGDNGGPTDGLLPAEDDDGLTVSFEFSEDETVVGSSLVRWNIGEVQWLEASYPASGTGVVRVIDPDLNLNPEAVDNFNVDVWSDSDAGGIDLTVTETNEATGIFEGTVNFTVTAESTGHRLRVAEGDTVTAEYEDNTLPDPYNTSDVLDITATSLIGTVVPPLERVIMNNLRTLNAFGNSVDSIAVDQQVQISIDLSNGQDREQPFAYLVQVQDANGVTVSLSWTAGTLGEGQSFSQSVSWTPLQSGSYTATAFAWEALDSPTALAPPVSTTIDVS